MRVSKRLLPSADNSISDRANRLSRRAARSRGRVADGDAGGDAFDVRDVFQTALQGFVLRTQRGNGFLAGANVGAAA